jgi:phasin family protein
MAESQSKIDVAAEKAFAQAVEKHADAKPIAKTEAKSAKKPLVLKDVPEKKVAAKKAAAKKATPKKALAKKAAPKKATTKKTALKKTAAKKVAAKKTTARKSTGRTIAAKKPASTKTNTIVNLKEDIMAKAKKADLSKTVKTAAENIQGRAKTAYSKGSEMTSDVVEFHKDNVEAIVASGKVLASGVQDMGRTAIADTKVAAGVVTEDVKKMVAVKSPTELIQLQGEIARRNFDTTVAQTSKNVEAMMKLANDVFAPISSRASVAAEKFTKAA